MVKVAPHLIDLGSKISKTWLLQDASGRRFLIDTGHALERIPLLAQLFAAGVRMPGDLTAILLTHRHSDHAGNAAFFRKRFGTRVICHENDAGTLSGRTSAPSMIQSGQRLHEKILSAYEDRAPAFTEVDDLYSEGQWQWGFQVIAVPGHTEGSVMLYHEPTHTLFSGDSILNNRPFPSLSNLPSLLKRNQLRLADPGFSQDVESSHLAVKRFLKHLPPQMQYLCPGHGEAVSENAAKLLKSTFASNG